MIRHLSVVECDACGDVSLIPGADADQARHFAATKEAFIRRDGRDLCPSCVDLDDVEK